jgi:hypothetical protein
MIRRLIAPLMLTVFFTPSGMARAQHAFPAPLPAPQGIPPLATGPIGKTQPAPPSSAGDLSTACATEFLALREDAERRGSLIKAASERHALPSEACKLLSDFSKAELKMIQYVRIKTARGIPADILDQLKAGHKKTSDMLTRVCSLAQTTERWPEGTVTTDFGDPAFKQR